MHNKPQGTRYEPAAVLVIPGVGFGSLNFRGHDQSIASLTRVAFERLDILGLVPRRRIAGPAERLSELE